MKANILPILTLGAALLTLAPPVFAETENKGRAGQHEAKDGPLDENHFLQKAGAAGAAELKLAQAAEAKASSDNVKEIAKTLAADHSAANAELAAIAKAKSITISEPPAKDHKKHEEILKKTGEDFDAAFVAEMKECHKKDIALFETASKELKDPEVKAFVDKTLPVLKKHAELIKAKTS